MSEANFSKHGDAPTAFERQLVDAIDPKLERDVWALIARLIGAENVAVVLDYAAARAVNIPRREAFFRRLWKPQRDAAILSLVRAGNNDAIVAELCGCSEDAVFRVRHAHRRAIAGVKQ